MEVSDGVSQTDTDLSGPMPRDLPGMDEAWQAHLFALTVHLNERGVFTWATWGEYFGRALKTQGLPETGADKTFAESMPLVNSEYFHAWQQALEAMLSDLEIVLPLDIGLRAQASACYPRLARAPLVFRALAQAPGKAGPA